MWALVYDGLVGLSVWVLFRLLGLRRSFFELLVTVLVLAGFNYWMWGFPFGEEHPFPRGPVSGFVASCARHADTATCECARDRLEAELGRAELVRLAVRIGASGTLPPPLASALTRCAEES
jgi:hypothetical protein